MKFLNILIVSIILLSLVVVNPIKRKRKISHNLKKSPNRFQLLELSVSFANPQKTPSQIFTIDYKKSIKLMIMEK